MQSNYLTLPEAAAFLKISKSTLYKKTHLRKISFNKPGGKLILFLQSDLENYLKRNQYDSKEQIENEFLKNFK